MQLPGPAYKHDQEECGRIGSRIAIHLAKCEYGIALDLLERTIAKLQADDLENSRAVAETVETINLHTPIAELPGVSSRLVNFLEKDFGAVYLSDLSGVTEGYIVAIGGRDGRALFARLEEVLKRAGISFPF